MTRAPRRPLGEFSLRTLQLARVREVTYLDVAQTLQISRRDASVTVYNLKARGQLQEVERRAIDGARKPVPVLRAAEPAAVTDSPLVLILDWPRGP